METVLEFDKFAAMGYPKRFASALKAALKEGKAEWRATATEAGAKTTPEVDEVVAKPKSKALPWIIGGGSLLAGAALATALSPKNSGVEKMAYAAGEFGKMFKDIPEGAKVSGEWSHIHPKTKVETKGVFEGGFDNIPKGAKVKGEWTHESGKGTFDNKNYKAPESVGSRVGHGLLGTAAVVGGSAAAGVGMASQTTPYQVNP